MAASDHADEALRVYHSRTLDDGWWCSLYGDIRAPEGWEPLPAGDAFVTRQVKRLGFYWVVLRARKGYTESPGLLAPTAIQAARALAQKTKAPRELARERSWQRCEQREQAYRQQFTEAVLRFLDFAPRFKTLAQRIAQAAAEQATVVGSARVGRTARLSLEEKAELAARAHIRHHHTSYEDRLIEAGLFDLDESAHRDAKAQAQEEVGEFLERHRRRGGRRSHGGAGRGRR